VAAEFKRPCHVHLRGGGEATGVQSLGEVLSAAAVSGAPLHVVHINSTGGDAVGKLLEMIIQARSHGMDVTTEAYPYTASATRIESALFNEGWQTRRSISYGDLQWAATGERLTEETFTRYRKEGGSVIVHNMREANIQFAITQPTVMIASDGNLRDGRGHPRSTGTFARVLGLYVREQKSMTWSEAIRKMSLLPAQRLEGAVPSMKNKGRIRVGADADITLFNPETVIDRATYQDPARYSTGIPYVIVGGHLVIRQGQTQNNALPGKAVRAARQ
jgi:dihydroorotase